MRSAVGARPRDPRQVSEAAALRQRKKPLISCRVRLNVHHATVKSIRRTVKSHRRRILRAQKLRRRLRSDTPANEHGLGFDLPCDAPSSEANQRQGRFRKLVSTDSDELEIDGCSEEDQEDQEAAAADDRLAGMEDEVRGCEVDSGCDEWDLSKDALEWATLIICSSFHKTKGLVRKIHHHYYHFFPSLQNGHGSTPGFLLFGMTSEREHDYAA